MIRLQAYVNILKKKKRTELMTIDYVEAFFLDDKTNELNIVTTAETIPQYNLYWTYQQDKLTDDKQLILTDNQKNRQFDFAYDRQRRQYFIIEFTNGDQYLFGHRILPIAGMYNFRDIGGYVTTTGRRLKWGVGYRSDYLYNLDDAGLPYIQSLGLKTIIDFRSSSEVKDRPNKDIGAVKTFVFDPSAHVAQLAGTLQSGSMNDDAEIIANAKKKVTEDENAGDVAMREQQEKFVDRVSSQKAFGNALRTLADEQAVPAMLHCRGGKDRTGFGLMLLEGLLGVDESMLVYDYMLTHRAREKKNAKYYQRFLETTGDERIAQYMYALFDTKPQYIEASIHKIMNEYGSIKGYVQEVLAINAAEIAILEKNFLE